MHYPEESFGFISLMSDNSENLCEYLNATNKRHLIPICHQQFSFIPTIWNEWMEKNLFDCDDVDVVVVDSSISYKY